MPRILEPGQIEALAQRSIPRIRLPDRAEFFAARGRRLRQLAETGAPGHTIGDYLRLMAALQVYWVALASRLLPDQVPGLEIPGLCPVCGTLPVASIVRAEARSEGYRFLHCALCGTEWHLVRITCSQCQSTADIAYHSIEGDSGAIRAESCDQCHTYRKILYQEKDTNVDPVADDLASLALDLLMSEAGYHRGSGNPLLWHRP